MDSWDHTYICQSGKVLPRVGYIFLPLPLKDRAHQFVCDTQRKFHRNTINLQLIQCFSMLQILPDVYSRAA
jgi:hypothetical protein